MHNYIAGGDTLVSLLWCSEHIFITVSFPLVGKVCCISQRKSSFFQVGIRSAYEAYDKFSPAFQNFLESLTAFHSGEAFIEVCASN